MPESIQKQKVFIAKVTWPNGTTSLHSIIPGGVPSDLVTEQMIADHLVNVNHFPGAKAIELSVRGDQQALPLEKAIQFGKPGANPQTPMAKIAGSPATKDGPTLAVPSAAPGGGAVASGPTTPTATIAPPTTTAAAK